MSALSQAIFSLNAERSSIEENLVRLEAELVNIGCPEVMTDLDGTGPNVGFQRGFFIWHGHGRVYLKNMSASDELYLASKIKDLLFAAERVMLKMLSEAKEAKAMATAALKTISE